MSQFYGARGSLLAVNALSSGDRRHRQFVRSWCGCHMRSAPLFLFLLTTHTSWKVVLHVYLIVTWTTYSGNDVRPEGVHTQDCNGILFGKKSLQTSLRILRQCCPGLFKYDLSLLNRHSYKRKAEGRLVGSDTGKGHVKMEIETGNTCCS